MQPLRPPVEDSAFGATHFRGHFCVHCRYGLVTRRLPEGDVVDRLAESWFPATLPSKLRGLDLAPAGLSPAEHASLLAGHTTGRADFPHPAFLSRPVKSSLLAGRCSFRGDGVEAGASHRDTRPGSGRTRCLCVPIAVATSDGLVARCRPVDEVIDRDDRPLVKVAAPAA